MNKYIVKIFCMLYGDKCYGEKLSSEEGNGL